MPTVPTSFVPQVALQEGGQVPFQAPGVQPVENLAARQAMQFGQQTEQLGAYMARGAMEMDFLRQKQAIALQDKLDEARAKEIETDFLKTSMDMLHGNNGYLYSGGKDAETRYAQTSDQLSQAMQSALSSAENDMQRRLLAPTLARHAMTFTAQAAEHREKEARTYFGNESAARSQQFVNLAINSYQTRNNVDADGNPTGDFHSNMIVALNEMRDYAHSVGIPDGSAQMKAIERKVHTAATVGVANRLVTDKSYHAALEYVQGQVKLGLLDEGEAEKLLSSITDDRRRQMVGELTDSIRSNSTLDTPSGTANMTLPARGRIIIRPGVPSDASGDQMTAVIEASQGTPIVAPADGTIIDRYKNDSGKWVVRIAVDDRTVVALEDVAGDLIKGQAQRVTRGQVIGMVGASGQTGYGVTVDGKPIDPRAANELVPTDRDAPRRRLTLREQLELAERIPDRDIRKSVQSNLRSEYAQEEATARQEYNEHLDKVVNFLADENHSVNAIPFADWSRLKPVDQAKLLGAQRERDDLSAMEEIARDPSKFDADWLEQNRWKLTRSTYIKLRNDWNTMTADKQYETSVDADQINSTLIDAGVTQLVNPQTDDDKTASISLRANIKESIRAEQLRLNRKLSEQEKQALIDKHIVQKVKVGGGWFTKAKELPLTAQPPEAILNAVETDEAGNSTKMIPDEVRAEIEATLQSNGLAVTPQNIVRLWIKAGMRR